MTTSPLTMRCNSVYRRQINDFQFEGHEKSRLEHGLHEYSKRPWRDQAAPLKPRAAPSSARCARSARRTQAKNRPRMTGRHAPPVFPPVFAAQPPAKPRRASLHAGKKSSRCANEAGRCTFPPAPWRTKPMRRPRAAGSAVSWRWAWGAAPAHRAQRRADQTRSAVIPR